MRADKKSNAFLQLTELVHMNYTKVGDLKSIVAVNDDSTLCMSNFITITSKLFADMKEALFFNLPPANEVWGKVMILHLSVILFIWDEGLFPIACWDTPPGQTPCPRQTPLRQTPPRQTPPSDTTGCGQQVGGTHPTGMHTCFSLFSLRPGIIQEVETIQQYL